MRTTRILIVEDEAIVSIDIQESLKHLGYEITGAVDTGRDALLSVEKDVPDLIFMDIALKGDMDGIQTAAYIRDRYHIPVVYLTAHADESTLQRAKVTTPYGYILKPFKELDLKPAIELALYRHRQEYLTANSKNNFILNFEADTAEIGSALQIYNQVSPFSELPESKRQALAGTSQIKNIAAGQYIAHEGDSNVTPFIVVSGRVLMLKSSYNGKDLIVDFILPGDVFPLAVALEKDLYPLTIKTQMESKILCIPKTALKLILQEFPAAYQSISEQITSRLRESFDLSRKLAHDRVEVRVASALLGLHARFGLKSDKDEPFVLEITRKDLADLTGISPETSSRICKAMESDGLLDLRQSGIVVIKKPARLGDIIEEY